MGILMRKMPTRINTPFRTMEEVAETYGISARRLKQLRKHADEAIARLQAEGKIPAEAKPKRRTRKRSSGGGKS
jgi:DNA-directed RNA polymerase sigma subunit (sigma70/sigma32)